MLAAGTLGTAAGDWVADETPLGLGYGSLVLLGALIARWLRLGPIGKMTKPWYWLNDCHGADRWHNTRRSPGKPSRVGSRALGQHHLHELGPRKHSDPVAPTGYRETARGLEAAMEPSDEDVAATAATSSGAT